MLEIGKKAPAFTLLNQNQEKVALKELLGTHYTLLYFYPKAMTPGCTTQACELRDNKASWSRKKLRVFGVSPDPAERLQKFIEKEQLNFDLLSDPHHKIAEKYGAWGLKKMYGKEYQGILRSSYLISPTGKIVGIIPKVNVKKHYETVMNLLENARQSES